MNHATTPMDEQVIVITGATAGIGLATAREAARRGACIVIAGPQGFVLDELVEQLGRTGCEVLRVVADPTNREGMDLVAAQALDRFGHIDTWINTIPGVTGHPGVIEGRYVDATTHGTNCTEPQEIAGELLDMVTSTLHTQPQGEGDLRSWLPPR